MQQKRKQLDSSIRKTPNVEFSGERSESAAMPSWALVADWQAQE